MHKSTRVTISFYVPNRRHIIIGAIIAAAAITAAIIYIQLPTNHPYTNVIINAALASTCLALAYWLRRVMQKHRGDHEGLSESIAAGRAEAQLRQETVLAQFEQIGSRLTDLSEEIGENRSAIKEIVDAVNANTTAIEDVTGAIEALQDCYIDEGKAPTHDADKNEEAPRDFG
jgi:septal ring factor EnvC (AmiA/AmiB activator)